MISELPLINIFLKSFMLVVENSLFVKMADRLITIENGVLVEKTKSIL
jgi:ABC-type siderophore export system fused ATPase/permease subunit